jgi:hypothetical protein
MLAKTTCKNSFDFPIPCPGVGGSSVDLENKVTVIDLELVSSDRRSN